VVADVHFAEVRAAVSRFLVRHDPARVVGRTDGVVRIFKKKPPPGWQPTIRVSETDQPPAARWQARANEVSLNDYAVLGMDRPRSTASPTWTANQPTDSVPWTATDARLRELDQGERPH
jgi:hypothetical protein